MTLSLPFRSHDAKACLHAPRCSHSFTLIEIMVVITLLTVIVLGLLAMFDQTQRAFRVGMTQTDVLESGRIVTDLITRELKQTTPSYLAPANTNSINFYAGIVNGFNGVYNTTFNQYCALVQDLPGSAAHRINAFDDLFFLTRQNQTWTAIGYFVRTNAGGYFGHPWAPVGTLYRFQATNSPAQFRSGQVQWSLFNAFLNATNYPSPTSTPPPSGAVTPLMNVSKILDGLVEFQVRTFDFNGTEITTQSNNINAVAGGVVFFNANTYWHQKINSNIRVYATNQNPGGMVWGLPTMTIFSSNAVPAYVELELGVLERQTLEQYRSIPDIAPAQDQRPPLGTPPAFFSPGNPAYRFLTNANTAAHVHVFRQRIAIPSVDPSAYQ